MESLCRRKAQALARIVQHVEEGRGQSRSSEEACWPSAGELALPPSALTSTCAEELEEHRAEEMLQRAQPGVLSHTKSPGGSKEIEVWHPILQLPHVEEGNQPFHPNRPEANDPDVAGYHFSPPSLQELGQHDWQGLVESDPLMQSSTFVCRQTVCEMRFSVSQVRNRHVILFSMLFPSRLLTSPSVQTCSVLYNKILAERKLIGKLRQQQLIQVGKLLRRWKKSNDEKRRRRLSSWIRRRRRNVMR